LDAYQGLFRINLTTNKKELIKLNIDNRLKGIYNDFVFDPQLNVVYITVSSTKWNLEQISWGILEFDQSGLVLAADLNTKKVTKLLDGLGFANGIELTKDNNWLLITETVSFKIHKVSLQTVQKAVKNGFGLAKTDVGIFAKELIGEPDNIRLGPEGDIWVGIFMSRQNGKTLRDYLSNFPFIRKAIARLIYSISLLFDFINVNVFSNHALEEYTFLLRSGHIFYPLMPKSGAILRLDGKTGETKQILGSNKFSAISEAIIDSSGDLYFGSPRNRFLGRLKKGQY